MAQKVKAKYDITLTEKAAGKITELAKKDNKQDQGLKLFVFPGGCSGFQYGMDFVDKPEETDVTMKQHGVTLYVDKDSLELLKGVKIDFVDTLQGSGFKIDNPNVTSSCGCGKSFC